MASLRRLRHRVSSEEQGSLLVEVLVSAAILLTVSAGVVLALQTAHAQSGLQRTKALATDVAQTELDALRSRAYNTLRPLALVTASRPVTEGGTVFTVVSTTTPVAQSDAPSGCSNQRARDYLSLKTTVTWPNMGTRKPVVLDTLVAAPVGVGGGLVVNVTGGAGQPVPGIPLLLTPAGGSATTDASGCARWDAVAAGTGYALTTAVDGYVQPNGVKEISVSNLTILAEDTAQQNLAYDRGGTVSVKFQQRPSGSASATDAPGSLPAAISVSNASATVTKTLGTSSGATGAYGLFYPFTSAYGVYADSCGAAQPPATAPASGRPSVIVPAGGSVATTLELPSLGLRFTNNGSLPTATDGITVRIKTACPATVISGRTVKTSDGTLTNPGLPYGTGFTVCAATADNTRRVVRTNVSNTTYAAPSGSSTEARLTTNGQSCPF